MNVNKLTPEREIKLCKMINETISECARYNYWSAESYINAMYGMLLDDDIYILL